MNTIFSPGAQSQMEVFEENRSENGAESLQSNREQTLAELSGLLQQMEQSTTQMLTLKLKAREIQRRFKACEKFSPDSDIKTPIMLLIYGGLVFLILAMLLGSFYFVAHPSHFLFSIWPTGAEDVSLGLLILFPIFNISAQMVISILRCRANLSKISTRLYSCLGLAIMGFSQLVILSARLEHANWFTLPEIFDSLAIMLWVGVTDIIILFNGSAWVDAFSSVYFRLLQSFRAWRIYKIRCELQRHRMLLSRLFRGYHSQWESFNLLNPETELHFGPFPIATILLINRALGYEAISRPSTK